jgi:hypothetical protein
MKVMNEIIRGCNKCPAYSFHQEDGVNGPHHLCNKGAYAFPTDMNGWTYPERSVDDGYFAADCPLPEER